MSRFLIVFDTHDGSSVITEYFSTTGFKTGKTETPAEQSFEPRLKDAGRITICLFKDGTTNGSSTAGIGLIKLNNGEGVGDNTVGINRLRTRGLDGRDLVIREEVIPEGSSSAAFPADFPIRFSGTIAAPTYSQFVYNLDVRNRTHQVGDLSYQPIKYLGDNAGPNDLEGDADLEGLPKPKAKGQCKNITPALINESGEIWQASSDECLSVTIYEGRKTATIGTTHATLALFQAATPSAGTFDVYLGDNTKSEGDNERACYIRAGTTPAFLITMDVTGGAFGETAADRTAAQLTDEIFTERGFTLDSASVTAMDTDVSFEVQHWQGTKEIKVGQVIDLLMDSVSGFWTDKLDETFVVGRFKVPSGTPALTINIKTLLIVTGNQKRRYIVSRDPDRGIPVFRINLGFGQNYTIMTEAELTGTAAEVLGEQNFVNKSFSKVTDTDATVQTKHLNSPELNKDTKIVSSADAVTQAAFLNTLYGEIREFIEVRIPVELAGSLELHDVIKLDNKLYRLMCKRIRFPSAKKSGKTNESDKAITLQLWGGVAA